jgi:hypothetical protein
MIDNLVPSPIDESSTDINSLSERQSYSLIRGDIEAMLMKYCFNLRLIQHLRLYSVINSPISFNAGNHLLLNSQVQIGALDVLSLYGLDLEASSNSQEYNPNQERERLVFPSQNIDGLSFTRVVFIDPETNTNLRAEWRAHFEPKIPRKAILEQAAAIVPPGLQELANAQGLVPPTQNPKFYFGPKLTNHERIQFAKFLYEELEWEEENPGRWKKVKFLREFGIPAAITGLLPQGPQADRSLKELRGQLFVASAYEKYYMSFKRAEGNDHKVYWGT